MRREEYYEWKVEGEHEVHRPSNRTKYTKYGNDRRFAHTAACNSLSCFNLLLVLHISCLVLREESPPTKNWIGLDNIRDLNPLNPMNKNSQTAPRTKANALESSKPILQSSLACGVQSHECNSMHIYESRKPSCDLSHDINIAQIPGAATVLLHTCVLAHCKCWAEGWYVHIKSGQLITLLIHLSYNAITQI